jgi:hypothetical protein
VRTFLRSFKAESNAAEVINGHLDFPVLQISYIPSPRSAPMLTRVQPVL